MSLNDPSRGVTTWLTFPPATGVCTWLSLAGETEVIYIAVDEEAPIVEQTVQEAVKAGMLEDDALLIAIERGDDMITPQGNTEIKPNDIVTVFSPDREKKRLWKPSKRRTAPLRRCPPDATEIATYTFRKACTKHSPETESE